MILDSLAFNLKREQALKLFKSRMRRLKLGQFLFETSFYLPYFLFRVEILNSGKLSTQALAIDAVTGELDLYGFEQIPTEFVAVETTQFSQTLLSEQQAFALLKEKLRRSLYLRGFFKISDLSITGKFIQCCYLPYWVGFYTRNQAASLEVIDGVRGCFEGRKVRNVVTYWFGQEDETRRPKQTGER